MAKAHINGRPVRDMIGSIKSRPGEKWTRIPDTGSTTDNYESWLEFSSLGRTKYVKIMFGVRKEHSIKGIRRVPAPEMVANQRGEKWVCVEGSEHKRKHYSTWYEVSNQGRVKKCKGWYGIYHSEKLCSFQTGNKGSYRTTTVRLHGVVRARLISRLVAQHFLDDWDTDLQVDHVDGNIYNNCVENLRMVTGLQNHEYRRTRPDWVARKQARIDAQAAKAEERKAKHEMVQQRARDMAEMRRGGASYAEIGARFGIDHKYAWQQVVQIDPSLNMYHKRIKKGTLRADAV